jgi:Flp pilus assembly protein TadD
LRQLQRDAADHPEDLHLQALLALAYLEDGQEAAAQYVVNQVFAGRPDPLLYLQVAQQLLIAEEPALAVLVLHTGHQTAPDDQPLLHMLLFAHILNDAPAGPIEDLADELDRADGRGQTTCLLAETYLHYLDGDLEEALATLDEARAGGTYQREMEYLEGLVQWDLGQPARATTVLRRAELNDSPPWLTPYIHRLLEEIGEA